jgi:hypothetical protein
MALSHHWVKSSYSDPNGGNCVQARRHTPGTVQIRDSRDPNGTVLTVSAQRWRKFLHRTARPAPVA